MQKTKTDFLIVGGGLAGSVLALHLLTQGKQVVLIGNAENHSSRIAAGLFNPITGKVLSKTWLADDLFPYLHTFYRTAEKETGKSFFHPLPIYRPFLSIEEQNEWMAKSAEPAWQPFIEKVYLHSTNWEGVKDPLGGLLLKQTGFVNMHVFLDAVKEKLDASKAYRIDHFEHEKLRMSDPIQYKDIEAEKIIFCEGVNVLQNPLFHWAPLKPLKGETLSVQAKLPTEAIINRGVYAVPQQPGIFKIGATYEARDLQPGITEKGKAELHEKFTELFALPYTVVQQEWGLRPTVPDRRPLLGKHPAHDNVFIFNGLGTKGVSLAPYMANLLTEFIITGKSSGTYSFVDVNRYNSLYWKAVKTHED